ncbi:sugar porter family MFS transporter [Draconibacterium sp. IB214405]|uniref:sugar porter family MFS transporter n=1 Tax=Draconibacterium sp. IB214405 TaxID=3097352 RepID=UPI002A180D46|nr:sugar porter family MFS transporter [Draconibacterium sp. IB214405]MDX8338883.1 sugar porter family MFS transporter [Draconibacterium sp. IB214405]
MKQQSVVGVAIIIALGGFLFGYDIAMMSGTTKQLESLYNLNSFWLGFTVAIAIMGTIIGTIIIGRPAEKYGRKKSLLLLSGLFALSTLGSAFAINWGMLLACRFITGVLLGSISVVTPMFIAEISPAKKRGRLVLLNQFFVVTALFLAFAINYFLARSIAIDSWRWMIGVEFIPAATFFLLLNLVPESPRWLVNKDRNDEALAVFQRIKATNPAAEVQMVKEMVQQEEAVAHGKLFVKANRFPIMIAILIAAFNQLAGINALMIYAPRVFEMAGFGDDASLLQSISVGATNLLFTFVALFLIDRYGRRTLLMVGSVGMVFFLGMLSKSFFTNNFSDFGGYGVMIYLMGFIAFFAFSQGAVIWVVISEIFPNKVRSQGQALGSFTHWIFAAALIWGFPSLSEIVGGGFAFGFFAVMMVLHFFFAWKVLPETKGKSLEEIQLEMKKK